MAPVISSAFTMRCTDGLVARPSKDAHGAIIPIGHDAVGFHDNYGIECSVQGRAQLVPSWIFPLLAGKSRRSAVPRHFRLAASRFNQFAFCFGAPSHHPSQGPALTPIFNAQLQQGFVTGEMGGWGSVCRAPILSPSCPLWVKSRHRGYLNECPLYPQQRTSSAQ